MVSHMGVAEMVGGLFLQFQVLRAGIGMGSITFYPYLLPSL